MTTMKTIHFSTDNVVGINLAVGEQPNGDLLLCRVFQTVEADKAKVPELFTVRAEERHAVCEHLMKAHSPAKPSRRKPKMCNTTATDGSKPLNLGQLQLIMNNLPDPPKIYAMDYSYLTSRYLSNNTIIVSSDIAERLETENG